MMGETGPCGPCSEIHVDLTPQSESRGARVNAGSPDCIEVWNHVFIQFNANPDGTFSALPAQHVDTGMGFERVTSFIQCTKGFTDFSLVISNYETDIFRPIFDELEKLSGKKYGSTLPTGSGSAGTGDSPVAVGHLPTASSAAQPPGRSEPQEPSHQQVQVDIAFRVIADHIRTLSFAIADGIQPSNDGRGYVLRRILRRAVRYGRTLGFHEPFFYKLVDVLAETMGGVFPEIRARKKHVQEVIHTEETAFNKTLDRGIELFDEIVNSLQAAARAELSAEADKIGGGQNAETAAAGWALFGSLGVEAAKPLTNRIRKAATIPAGDAFKLYDTYGFPLDLTELMARERGLTVDVAGFNKLMDEQKARARAAQKKEIIALSQIEIKTPTQFVGFDKLDATAQVLEVVSLKGKTAVVLDTSACYAEAGGQVGDTGELEHR